MLPSPRTHSCCLQAGTTPSLTSAAPGPAGTELLAEAGGKPATEPEGLPGLSPAGRSLLPAAQEALEQGALLLAQAAGQVQLCHSPGLHHQHAVRVQDGVEPAEQPRPGHTLGNLRRNPTRCLACWQGVARDRDLLVAGPGEDGRGSSNVFARSRTV